jgi:hypothetical protein
VYPTDLDGIRLYRKLAVEQPLIETVSRTKKHLMLAKLYWPGVAISSAVVDGVNGHRMRSEPHDKTRSCP